MRSAMRRGREVVEDDARTGLNLRDHPIAFPRKDLHKRGITPVPTPCGRHGQRIETAGSSSSAGVPVG